MNLTIQQLEDAIKDAPDKSLPVHVHCYSENIFSNLASIELNNKSLVLMEGEDEIDDEEFGYNMDEEENEDEEEE